MALADKKVVVVVPIYKNALDEYEKISLIQMLNVLERQEICFVLPESLNMPIDTGKRHVERFLDCYFTSTESYSRLLMSEEFYKRFIEYEYMLICQLDVFVFEDKTAYFCGLGYDYIGAPWLAGYTEYNMLKRNVLHVGNGGFSLRNVESCLKMVAQKNELYNYFSNRNEDVFFSACDGSDFSVAPLDIALSFSFEREVRRCYELNQNKLPFGCHAWQKYDLEFILPHIKKYGYDVNDLNINNGIEDKKNVAEYDWLYRCSCLFEDNELFDSLPSKISCMLETETKSHLYLWGAGYWGICIRRILNDLGVRVHGYIDGNERIQGSMVENIAVSSPDVIDANSKIIVSTDRKHYGDITKQLNDLGLIPYKDYILWEDLLPKGTRNYE